MSRLIERLHLQARKLPPRLADAARFVAAHPFDSATTPMRSLARRTGHSPATFTRLAQTLGYTGWEPLRAALVEIARKGHAAPYSNRPLPKDGTQSLCADILSADLASLSVVSLGVV